MISSSYGLYTIFGKTEHLRQAEDGMAIGVSVALGDSQMESRASLASERISENFENKITVKKRWAIAPSYQKTVRKSGIVENDFSRVGGVSEHVIR